MPSFRKAAFAGFRKPTEPQFLICEDADLRKGTNPVLRIYVFGLFLKQGKV
jgi:hypothetical protein